MEVAVLRSVELELRAENDGLRQDRAILSARIDRLERWVESVRQGGYELLTHPRVLQEYSPGVLHAVPVASRAPRSPAPAPNPAAVRLATLRSSMGDLPNPADRVLQAIAIADAPATIERVAEMVGLKATGGQFKRGLAVLLTRKLVRREDGQLFLVVPS